jgi:hypothetical protein
MTSFAGHAPDGAALVGSLAVPVRATSVVGQTTDGAVSPAHSLRSLA